MYLFQQTLLVCICAWIARRGTLGAGQISQARLVGGSSNGTGRLELLYNGEWMTVYGSYSSSYFNDIDAKVACRMLGYENSGVAFVFTKAPDLFGQGTGSVLNHNNFNCKGNETNLRQCGTSSWSVSTSTSHTYDVGISCEKTALRLADGDTPQSGRVEVFFKGQWSSICDTSFDNEDARAVCNILGYHDTGIAKAFTGSHFGTGAGDIVLSSVDCKGTETDIKMCRATWGTNNCNHRKDAGVNCASTPIRLVNGPTNSSGRVEIYHGGHWGTICGNSNFDKYDVSVICKMLGIDSPNAFGHQYPFYGEGNGHVIVSNLNCDGSESDIASCQSYPWSVSSTSSCSHTNDVGVNCEGVTPLRLVDGTSEQSGRVEVLHNGHWGTISDNYFDNHDLTVICRMMGYAYSSKSFFMKGGHYGNGIGEIVATRLQCNGAESDIGQCSAYWWPKSTSESHSHDVGVNCDGVIPIRLSGGDGKTSGRVEMLHNGKYGTICSRSFDRLDLTVVCRMLGIDNISQDAYWYPAATYAQGLGEIVVSDLACNGIEHSVGQCTGRWPAYSSCDHSEDVFVNCNGTPDNIRLVGGHNSYTGRVEISHSGQWATICDDSFDRADAVVICRMLKFKNPEKAVAYSQAHFGAGNQTYPIVVSDLHCNGLENNLGQCNPTWNPNGCGHSEDVGVDCCPGCQDVIVG